MRGHPRQATPEPLIGLKLHLEVATAAQRALARTVELVMFEGGYAGLQPVEGGRANLCMLVEKDRYAGLGRDWRRLVTAVPHLAGRLAGARPCWSRPLAVAGLAYGYLHPARPCEALYRIGDQLAVVPSFTGDGMAMAMRSGALVARALRAGEPAPRFHADAAAEFRRPMRVARLVAAAGRRPWLQQPLLALCQAMPGLMGVIAHATRIRDASA
jgi:flavin-dependent dehydrogenase